VVEVGALMLDTFLQIDPLPLRQRLWHRGMAKLDGHDSLFETDRNSNFLRQSMSKPLGARNKPGPRFGRLVVPWPS
jgi:hypothetical protein